MAELTAAQQQAMRAAQQRIALQNAAARVGQDQQAPAEPAAPFVPPDGGRFEARGASPMQQLKIAGGYLLNSNPKARQDILRNTLGDQVNFEQDPEGRTIASMGDERAYLNPPGLDYGDVVDFAGEVLKFSPAAGAARLVGGAGKILGTTRAMLGGGAASAGIQAGSDALSGAFGSEQGVEPGGVVMAGAGGALGELGGSLLTKMTPSSITMTPAAKEATESARDLGIDLYGAPGAQVRQAANAARGLSSATEGEGVAQVGSVLRQARQAANTNANRMYDIARTGNASVPSNVVQGLRDNAVRAMADYDVGADGMNPIARRLGDLEEIAGMEGPYRVKLNAMEQWRRRVSTMSPKDGSPAQAAATRLTQEYDNWLGDALDNQLIQGSPNDVQGWLDARSTWKAFKDTFDADKTINRLSTKETTPEQMSQWLLNASAINAKKESGEVVNKIKGIIGADSPQFRALQRDVVLDIAEPLFAETPDIGRFVANYDRFLAKNPTLNNALFGEAERNQLEELVKISRAVAKRPGASVSEQAPTDIIGRGLQILTRFTVGHGIAQGGARVQTAQGITGALRQAGSGPAARRAIIKEMTGALPDTPMLPIPAAIGAATGVEMIRE